jgi:uncharacterized protein YbcI
MATPEQPLAGDALLAAVTEAMVSLHERYYQRKPVTAKARWMGADLLACVLGGVYTDVEKTLIEIERDPIVRDNRSAFQNVMEDRFIEVVERLSGRPVLHFISSHNVGPDLESSSSSSANRRPRAITPPPRPTRTPGPVRL